jgi:hypothetical protein
MPRIGGKYIFLKLTNGYLVAQKSEVYLRTQLLSLGASSLKWKFILRLVSNHRKTIAILCAPIRQTGISHQNGGVNAQIFCGVRADKNES